MFCCQDEGGVEGKKVRSVERELTIVVNVGVGIGNVHIHAQWVYFM